MKSPPKLDWKLSLRTIVFAAVAAAILLGLAAGWSIPLSDRDLPRQAVMYRTGGDNLVYLYYLSRAAGQEDTAGRMCLQLALRYYDLSVQADRSNMAAALSIVQVLHALGHDQATQTWLSALMARQTAVEDMRAASALQTIFRVSSVRPEVVENARDLVADTPPGPLTLARAYESMGRDDLAEQAWESGTARARALLPALIAAAAVRGLLLVAGVLGILVAVIGFIRRRRAEADTVTEAPTPPVWEMREAIEALILWVFLGLLATGLLGRFAPEARRQSAAMLVIPSLIAAAGAIAWIWLATRGKARFGWRLGRSWRQIAVGIAAAGVFSPLALGVYQLIERFSNRGPTEHPMVPMLATAPGWQTKVFLVAVACVVVPVLEETLFRGVLYRALRRHWSFTPAAIASGIVFSVSHLNPTAVIPYLLLGILFAYLYERTGSLLTAAVAHGAFNAYTVVVVLAIFG